MIILKGHDDSGIMTSCCTSTVSLHF